MANEIKITIENHVGIICLNRPRAINALTPDMIMLIRKTLLAWANDKDIHLVMFEGEGEKGFCAGGDVRWTRDMVLSGKHREAFKFFALEYEMNHLISTFAKPIVALTHGVVMGGGRRDCGALQISDHHRELTFCHARSGNWLFL